MTAVGHGCVKQRVWALCVYPGPTAEAFTGSCLSPRSTGILHPKGLKKKPLCFPFWDTFMGHLQAPLASDHCWYLGRRVIPENEPSLLDFEWLLIAFSQYLLPCLRPLIFLRSSQRKPCGHISLRVSPPSLCPFLSLYGKDTWSRWMPSPTSG